MPKIVSDKRARQGPLGRPVLGVLLGGLILCAVAFGGYMVWVKVSSPEENRAASQPRTTDPSATGTTPR